MSDTVFHLQKRAKNVKGTPAYQPYSKVRIIVGEDDDGNQLIYEAGNDSARVLEITNPYGTQALANSILQRLSGFQYAPYVADSAILNPAAELGDGVSVGDVYSFIASSETIFDPIMSATISAVEDGEIDHEYPYETQESKEIARKLNGISTTFNIKLGEISTEIEDMDRGYSTRITQLSNSITAEVNARTNADSQMSSRITQNANSITAEVNARTTADGQLSSRITQNANSITSEINARTNADSQLSSRITQNANSITSEVTRATTAEGNLNSRITQTANSIQAQVNGIYAPDWNSRTVYKKNDVVKIVDGTTATYYKAKVQNTNVRPPNTQNWEVVSNPTVQSIANIGLDGVTLGYKASDLENSATITLNRNGVEIQSQVITMTNVTADSISANNITSGTMQAGSIAVDGKFTVKRTENNQTINCGWLGGGVAKIPDYYNRYADAVALGSASEVAYIAVTDGVIQDNVKSGSAMLRNRDAVVYCNASFFQNQSAGGTFTDVHPYCMMETLDGDHFLGSTYHDIRCSEQFNIVSDRRKKKDVDYNMSRYDSLFRSLKPCSYRLKTDADTQEHIGFIAQDVDEILRENGLDNSAFVGRLYDLEGYSNDDPLLALRYGEFTALNTHMIQKLMGRVDELEKKMRGSHGKSN